MLRERVTTGAGGAVGTTGGPSPVSPTGTGNARPPRTSGSSDEEEHTTTEAGSIFSRISGLFYSVWSPIDRMIGAGNVAPPSEVVRVACTCRRLAFYGTQVNRNPFFVFVSNVCGKGGCPAILIVVRCDIR
jgi:hypothetical protein